MDPRTLPTMLKLTARNGMWAFAAMLGLSIGGYPNGPSQALSNIVFLLWATSQLYALWQFVDALDDDDSNDNDNDDETRYGQWKGGPK